MLSRSNNGTLARLGVAAVFVTLGALSSGALAVDRVVLAEKFTATW